LITQQDLLGDDFHKIENFITLIDFLALDCNKIDH